MRIQFLLGSIFFFIIFIALGFKWDIYWSIVLFYLPIFLLGIYDMFQKKHAICRNFPVIGHFRYIFESIRPEIQQYFVENYEDGRPFTREERSIVYQRSKKQLDKVPFGTRKKVYDENYEWMTHSLTKGKVDEDSLYVKVGSSQCHQPYKLSLLNISAMSYGSLSSRAVEALNQGAQLGRFAHNTGEGGISPYHLKGKGDLIWQIGTGYFGARDADGNFSKEKFKQKASMDAVKMIEIKLSQGAKPGHGGILPAEKVTKEVAEIRGVPEGESVLSPPTHSAFNGPSELLDYVQLLRELSNGKPIGFKLCLGRKSELVSIIKTIVDRKIFPNFITLDGGEGGTGAAPLEFTNSLGTPLYDALIFLQNLLVGFGVKKEITVIVAGKVISSFDMAKLFSLGADSCYSARGMMFSLGCIQALRCHNNSCPTGVATQDKNLIAGLDVEDKANRVFSFHLNTIKTFSKLLEASGCSKVSDLKPDYFYRRFSGGKAKNFREIYPVCENEEYIKESMPDYLNHLWETAKKDAFV
ncbi:FMN-binding glutamate synthase family protein [Bacteriovoracaceae bacterium]|nr:FMN-binding glutamate synthase family protein [Bacteriovoracaceae bacterium]